VSDRLQPGQVYEHMAASLPFGIVTVAVEVRHLHYDDRLDKSFAGLRFYRLGGADQRQVERFVYQLQREARRLEV
jgi:c-di-GMP-binding flagellar brake protein YcgR